MYLAEFLGERFLNEKIKHKQMPSNLSGFYMQYTNTGAEDQEKYDFAFDIKDEKYVVQEESSRSIQPVTLKL